VKGVTVMACGLPDDGQLEVGDEIVAAFEREVHVSQGVAEHEGDLLGRTEIGDPVPGEHALNGHDEIVAVRRNRLEHRSIAPASVNVWAEAARWRPGACQIRPGTMDVVARPHGGNGIWAIVARQRSAKVLG
jgi:hypothetical protein